VVEDGWDGMRKGSLDKFVGHVWGVVKSVRFRLKISGSSDSGQRRLVEDVLELGHQGS